MHWHALFHWRRCSPHTRIFAKPSAVLSSSSPHCCTLVDESITPNSSFRQHSTPWDALSPTFCNFSVSTLGHGCTSCFSSNCLAIALLGCHLMKLRNHFVVARSHDAQHPLSTRSRRVGHSFGDACCCFDGFTRPASFLQRYNTNKTEYTGSLRWGDDRRDTSHNEHTTLQSSRNSQACLLTTMQSKWYNIKCSHMTTLT